MLLLPKETNKNMRVLKNDFQKGFSHIVLVIVAFGFTVIGLVGYRVYLSTQKTGDKVAVLPPVPTKDTPKTVEQPPHAQPAQPTAPPQVVPPPKVTAPATRQPASAAFVTSVQINGDAACQSSTLDALKLLSSSAPAHYATVTKYVSVIECSSQGSGMYAYENPPRYMVGDATRNAGTVWYAGTIAHDAGHSRLYHDYLSGSPGGSVPDDVWTGKSAERACLEAQYDALSKIGGTQSQLDYVKNVIDTGYYNVPYDQRWW